MPCRKFYGTGHAARWAHVRGVLNGAYPPQTVAKQRPVRHATTVAQLMADDEVAAVVTYIRGLLGHSRRAGDAW